MRTGFYKLLRFYVLCATLQENVVSLRIRNSGGCLFNYLAVFPNPHFEVLLDMH